MNAPEFEMVGVGFLVLGFMLIFIMLLGACIVYFVQYMVRRLSK